MKIKLALFEASYGYTTREPEQEKFCSYPRVSEYVEIDFPMMEDMETIDQKIAVIKKEIEEIESLAKRQVSELQKKEHELMALTVNRSNDGK